MRCVIFLIVILPLLALAGETNVNKPRLNKPVAKKDSGGVVGYKEITWDVLIPKEWWSPAKRFREVDLSALADNDPRAKELLDVMKSVWDKAPIEPSLDGQKIRIPGFVVPIELNGQAITEFLLVPHFGACIHVPPPPANQIIHVISPKPIKGLRTMDMVWVAGELTVARFSTQTDMGIGASGYQINSVSVTPYKEGAIISITPFNLNQPHQVPSNTPQ